MKISCKSNNKKLSPKLTARGLKARGFIMFSEGIERDE